MASRSNLTHIRALSEEDSDGIDEEAKELSVLYVGKKVTLSLSATLQFLVTETAMKARAS